MNCLLWNCRGANKPNFRRSIRYILKKYDTDVLALFETHAGGERARSICEKLGFENSFRVDAEGQSGGLWLLWRSKVGQVEVVECSNQFIHVKVMDGLDSMNLITVYAAPSVSRRSGLWAELKEIVRRIDGPLIMGGDFNTILRLDERTGGNGRLSADSIAFGEWINEMALIDLGFKGTRYTWRRGRVEQNFVAKRLDRVLCCAHARLKWQEARVDHLPFLASDHAPLYVQLCPEQESNPRRRPFRFEAAWMSHEGFKDLLRTSWNPEVGTPEALEGLKWKLKKWNREVFGNVFRRKEELMNELKEIQDLLEVTHTDELLAKEEQLLRNLELLLEQEETLWFQKSREKWIALGERNTTFFHTSTVIRRRNNIIEALKNNEGRWVTDRSELETLALGYFTRLYSMEDVNSTEECLSMSGFTELTSLERQRLDEGFTIREVEVAVRSMGRFKAPGPDGFQPVFYQRNWDIVGESVSRFVLEFFETGVLPRKTNEALIVLLAKVAKPERITQFRPVSLCNVLFKVITKMMVIRLKEVISKLVGPAQASFIPGRLSIDNIVVVQEAVHSMRRKKGKKGWMLLKLDLEKAYDRVRWDFMGETLEAAGLSAEWKDRIMECISEPIMSLLWNGEKTEAFKPARGLRQGDPLSPYLFVLCLERLCHLIDAEVGRGAWKPIRLSRGGPQLSHVCFADDIILFAEASVGQIRVIRRVLERFCMASGQKVSLEKSKIFFSENVSREMARLISSESGINVTRDLGKYLGMPILQKRMNKETFGETLERVSSRLAGWKSRTLSLAGRITLTKAVLSSIPVHVMSTIILPSSTLDRLDRLSRDFLWGTTAEKKRTHLVAWPRVCRKKEDGGLGIRMSRDMNKALIAKVGWRLLNDKVSLWSGVLRSKYKIGDVHDLAWLVPKGTWSSTWRSVGVGLRDVVMCGLGWSLGDGSLIKFWTDKWLMEEPISHWTIGELPEEEKRKSAHELWQNGVGWDIGTIAQYVPEAIRLRLLSVAIEESTGRADNLSWKMNENGCFSVRTAYAVIRGADPLEPRMENFYEHVWKVIAPERVRVFIWLVGNQVIMTNKERKRRHMGESDVCPVCKGAVETILHVLRDCPAMDGIWRRLVPLRERAKFFSQALLDWLYGNLATSWNTERSSWPTLFAMSIWWGWKWRCGNVFASNTKCRDRVKFLRELAEEVTKAHVMAGGGERLRGVEIREIGWTKPSRGWIKLNTDGASQGNPGLASAGGVLRDEEGGWLGGFALNIGICSAPLAELWGVYYGLILAWKGGWRKVKLEVDSKLVVGFLNAGVSDAHPLAFLVRLCHGFISMDWEVQVVHVYREANRLADGLANYAFLLALGLHMFESIPDVVVLCREEDAKGTLYPRQFTL